jgi:hypothetical protein
MPPLSRDFGISMPEWDPRRTCHPANHSKRTTACGGHTLRVALICSMTTMKSLFYGHAIIAPLIRMRPIVGGPDVNVRNTAPWPKLRTFL